MPTTPTEWISYSVDFPLITPQVMLYILIYRNPVTFHWSTGSYVIVQHRFWRTNWIYRPNSKQFGSNQCMCTSVSILWISASNQGSVCWVCRIPPYCWVLCTILGFHCRPLWVVSAFPFPPWFPWHIPQPMPSWLWYWFNFVCSPWC